MKHFKSSILLSLRAPCKKPLENFSLLFVYLDQWIHWFEKYFDEYFQITLCFPGCQKNSVKEIS